MNFLTVITGSIKEVFHLIFEKLNKILDIIRGIDDEEMKGLYVLGAFCGIDKAKKGAVEIKHKTKRIDDKRLLKLIDIYTESKELDLELKKYKIYKKIGKKI